MARYWFHYRVTLTDVDPPVVEENGCPIEQPTLLTEFPNIFAISTYIANSIGEQRKSPPGTVSVVIFGFSKLDEAALVYVPGRPN